MACVTRVFLVRHGETSYNAVRRIQGWRDIALDARGEQQACAVAARLAAEIGAHVRIAAVVSSPLQRARRTAETIAAALARTRPAGAVPPVADEARLKEIGFGVVEGAFLDGVPEGADAVANEQSLALLRDVWQRWGAGDNTAAVPGGESPADVAARARAAVNETLEKLFPPDEQKMFVDDEGVVVACCCCWVTLCL